MTLYVYRLIVSAWPTEDGQPWARYYGVGAAIPHDDLPQWLADLTTSAVLAQYEWPHRTPRARIAARLKINDNDEVSGVLMPKVGRRHYLSASGAYELARDMRAFGAVVTVERSQAVTEWVAVDGEPA